MLDHQPQPLHFGTSGRRGALIHLTQLEVFINALAELEYLQDLSREEGGIVRGEEFFFASDLRPSSTAYVPEQQGRGELAQAIEAAIRAAGMMPVYLGRIPTPALTAYALSKGKGSMMATGSHIPYDRNGYKTNTARGELLKHHEQPIEDKVREVRSRVYAQPYDESPFDVSGRFKSGHRELPAVDVLATEAYVRRYMDFFGAGILAGLRLVVYQHSAVGRDIVPLILRRLGAEVVEAGRSETFVPIDTENIDAERLAAMQALVDAAIARHGPVDALVATDGDSDRPLLLGVEATSGAVRFFGGDLVGMVTAEYLGAGAVVVPISCNDAIDRGRLQDIVEPKTRIGSPFVIAGMEAARAQGKQAVCGWEANGGFLTGSAIRRHGKILPALPTRDAVLPIVAVLAAAREQGLSLTRLFDQLPKRYSRAALIRQFPKSRSQRIMARYSPADNRIVDVAFAADGVVLRDESSQRMPASAAVVATLEGIRAGLSRLFNADAGFGEIARINYTDGVRVYFDNGDVAHWRPSGNADELRIYAVADSQTRADAIAAWAVAEPDRHETNY
jgi:phosphomannomutase